MRPQGWVVDMQHYLDDETGDLPAHLPSRIVNLACAKEERERPASLRGVRVR